MTIAKHQATTEESAFYAIGTASNAKELKHLESMIDSITPDEDTRAELRRAISNRFSELNAETLGKQTPRWN